MQEVNVRNINDMKYVLNIWYMNVCQITSQKTIKAPSDFSNLHLWVENSFRNVRKLWIISFRWYAATSRLRLIWWRSNGLRSIFSQVLISAWSWTLLNVYLKSISTCNQIIHVLFRIHQVCTLYSQAKYVCMYVYQVWIDKIQLSTTLKSLCFSLSNGNETNFGRFFQFRQKLWSISR